MKHARRQDLRQWLRSKPKPSMVEGLGLLCALMAALVPGLTVVGGMILNSDRSNPRVFVLLLLAAAGIVVLAWSFWKQVLERAKPQSPRTAAQGTRFRLGHLMVLAAQSFILGWLLHEGWLAPSQAFQDLCRSVPLTVAVQVCYVLMGLVVAAKIQRAAEKEEWPDFEALVAVTLMAPMVLVPVIGFALLVLLHGPGVLLLVPLAGAVLLPIVWLLGVVAEESRRSLDRVKRERRNRARRQAKLKKPGTVADAKTELPDSLSAGK